jgi:hypothetical protein
METHAHGANMTEEADIALFDHMQMTMVTIVETMLQRLKTPPMFTSTTVLQNIEEEIKESQEYTLDFEIALAKDRKNSRQPLIKATQQLTVREQSLIWMHGELTKIVQLVGCTIDRVRLDIQNIDKVNTTDEAVYKNSKYMPISQ